MPKSRRDKPTFQIPPDIPPAAQSGWVYRSDISAEADPTKVDVPSPPPRTPSTSLFAMVLLYTLPRRSKRRRYAQVI